VKSRKNMTQNNSRFFKPLNITNANKNLFDSKSKNLLNMRKKLDSNYSRRLNNTNMNWNSIRQTPESLENTSNSDSKYGEYVAKPMGSNASKKLFDIKKKKPRRPKTKEPSSNGYRKKAMNYEEIKKIREEFNLERHEVYTLMSEFNSMLYMQENINPSDDESNTKAKNSTEEEDDRKRLQKRNPYLDLTSENDREKNIDCNYFIENTTFMKGILPEVSKIIITALGLDADSPNTTISWENYVMLYCMLEKSSYKDDGVKYWCTFFDPKGIGSVEEKTYMNLLEMMVRGKSYEQSNHFT